MAAFARFARHADYATIIADAADADTFDIMLLDAFAMPRRFSPPSAPARMPR